MFHPCYCYTLLCRNSQYLPGSSHGSHQLTVSEENESCKSKCEVFSDEDEPLGGCAILQPKDEAVKIKCKVFWDSGAFQGDCCMVSDVAPENSCWFRLTVNEPMVCEKGGLGGNWEDNMDNEEFEETA